MQMSAATQVRVEMLTHDCTIPVYLHHKARTHLHVMKCKQIVHCYQRPCEPRHRARKAAIVGKGHSRLSRVEAGGVLGDTLGDKSCSCL